MLIVVVILISGRKTSINLNDYLSVGFDGYDTVGTAYADFDYEKFMNKYEEKLKWNNSYLKKLERSAENENFTNSFLAEILFEYTTGTPAELLYEYVINAGLLDVRSNLSNGDTVTWEWSISEDSQKEMEKMLDCKLIFSDQEFKVQGLEKADTVDPFSILQVEYEGISPNGSAYLQSNAKDEFESMIQFETDRSNGLSNGDILTVSVNDDNANYLLSNYGKILSPLQKEYTVEGLDEYVGSWNELTDDFKAMLKAESEDKIYAYTASEYAKSSLLSNLSYKGYIFSTLKNEEESSDKYNDIYIIYSGTVSSSDNNFRATTVYFPVEFSNILKSGDDLKYSENNGICGSSRIDRSSYSTRGYVNPLTCYREIVEKNRGVYEAECGDGFETYSSYESITKLSDISDNFKNELKKDAEDNIESYCATLCKGRNLTTSNVRLIGDYLLKAKNTDSEASGSNVYYLVYAVDVIRNEEHTSANGTIYFPVKYNGIIKMSDGNFMVSENEGMVGNSRLEVGDYYYCRISGYMDGTEMYSDLITANRDNYTYEVSDGLKQFGD